MRKLMHPVGTAACAECHDPHGHSPQTGLLRVSADGDRRASCFACHADMRGIDAGPHGQARTAPCATQSTACGPCHAVHAPSLDHDRGMWNVPLGTSLLSAAEGRCTGCHTAGGCAPAVAYSPHPALPMVDPAMLNHVGGAAGVRGGGMPLFGLDGARSATGVVACGTCHNPHGPAPAAAASAPADPALLRASKPMLRSFEPPNVCTTCHGFDALQRYLYFHRREEGSAPQTSAAAAGQRP
jgi:predicted CXXCH cytochrome family protein